MSPLCFMYFKKSNSLIHIYIFNMKCLPNVPRHIPHSRNIRRFIPTFLSFVFCLSIMLLPSSKSYAQAEFANIIETAVGPNTGIGTFSANCAGQPGFEIAITGDVAPGDTNIPGAPAGDGSFGLSDAPEFESVFGGSVATADNIEVEVAGVPNAAGQAITNTVVTTLYFGTQAVPEPTAPGALGFIIADVEQDQVQVCALDANGDPVLPSVIAGWYRNSFDGDVSDTGLSRGCNAVDDPYSDPMWDANTGTLVGGYSAVPGVRQTVYSPELCDNEAGSAWFVVDIPITQLIFKSQALGEAPDDPSQHFLIASLCEEFDLAIEKTLSSTPPFEPGDVVTFDIEVFNQGTLDATDIEITDYIPTGMTLVGGGAFSSAAAGTAVASIASLPAGSSTTISIMLMIDQNFTGMTLTNNAEITDVDNTFTFGSEMITFADEDGPISVQDGSSDDVSEISTNGDINDEAASAPGSADNSADVDDYDLEQIAVVQTYDLALIKIETSTGPYSAGDDVTFEIQVCNQGTLPSGTVEITDNIPAGMTLSAADANNWSGMPDGPVTNMLSNILPDACGTVDIVLTIDPDFMGTSLINNAEISMDSGDDADSTPNDNSQPDDLTDDNALDEDAADGGDDEDPEQITIIQSYDLALIKEETSSGPYSPGDDVSYQISVCNQGTLNSGMVTVTDNIPAGMTLSGADANNWSGPAVGPVTNTIAQVAPMTCETLDIVLTIDATFMGTSLINNAEISSDNGDDVDSTPGDNSQPNDFADNDDLDETDGGDDEDPEEVMVAQRYDLALIKEETSAGPYSPGDDVTYQISVCNQGTLNSGMVTVTDNIPAGMTLSGADGNNWSGPAAGPVTNTIAQVAPMTCETLDIVLTIDATFMGTSLINNAEISSDSGDDVDSTPGDNSQPDDLADNDALNEDAADGGDDEDPELIQVGQTYDLALIKEEISSGPYAPGDDVTYKITVCNQGTLTSGAVEVTDDIPMGMTLSTADNNNWSGMPAGPVTNMISDIAPMTCEELNIVLTIDANFTGATLVNNAQISDDSGNDSDSTPNDNSQPNDFSDDNDLDEMDGGDDEDPAQINVAQFYDLALIKQESSAGPYLPGDDVTYTITIQNQGTITANFFQVTDYIPAGMTRSTNDNNGWVGPATGPVTNNVIMQLLPGMTTTIDIVLTIDPAFTGTSITNNAEISLDDNDDVDSTPGNNSQPDDFADDNDLTETDGGDDEDPEQVDVCYCDATAEAGRMVYPATSDGCLDMMGSTVTLMGVPNGTAVVPPGYVLEYIVTEGVDYGIVTVGPTSTFIVDVPGWFTIHPIVYDPNVLDLNDFVGNGTTIFDVEDLLANDPCICGDVDRIGVELGAYFCCLDMLQLDMNPVPPLLHDANIGLLSKGTVNMPSSATFFTGGQFVEMQAGFEVIQGSVFEASIAPCSDIGN